MTTNELAATYDRIANEYAEDHQHDTWSLAMVERFVQLLHLSRRELPRVLNSFRRVLVRGGLLLVAVKEGRGSEVIAESEYGCRFERPFTYFGHAELTHLFERTGFRIREELRYVKRMPGKRPRLQFIVERREQAKKVSKARG